MTLLAQFVIAGLVIGVLYVVMALGLTFIYSIMRMTNWAMGEFFMVGSFIQYVVVTNVLGPDLWFVGVVVSAIGVFFLGAVVEWILLRPLFEGRVALPWRDSYATLITVALALFLRGAATLLASPHPQTPGSTLPSVDLGPLPISGDRLAAGIVGLLTLGLFYLLLNRTWVGLALRAASQSRTGAQTVGVDVLRLDQMAFGIGCALAGIAGALLASVFFVTPINGAVPVNKAFEIVIIAGLGSIPGTVLAGLILGLTESMGAALVSPTYQNAYGFLLVLVILVLRPRSGLFGERARVV